MKRVLLKYDVYNDMIECSDRIAENFDDVIGGIYSWIENELDGAEYRLIDGSGNIGHWINTDIVLKYLNTKCLQEGETEARLYKENVSKHVRVDNVAEF